MINEAETKKTKDFGMGLMIGTAVETQGLLMELIRDYEDRGIEEISLLVLKQMIVEASLKTMSPKGLVGQMILNSEKEEE